MVCSEPISLCTYAINNYDDAPYHAKNNDWDNPTDHNCNCNYSPRVFNNVCQYLQLFIFTGNTHRKGGDHCDLDQQ